MLSASTNQEIIIERRNQTSSYTLLQDIINTFYNANSSPFEVCFIKRFKKDSCENKSQIIQP